MDPKDSISIIMRFICTYFSITACKAGTYGMNCLETCGNCRYGNCDKVTGRCNHGCAAGYLGETCKQSKKSG